MHRRPGRPHVRLLFRLALAGLLALLICATGAPNQADEPVSWEEYGGLDGYYIARGWTEGRAIPPQSNKAATTGQVELPYVLHLPLVYGPPSPTLRETRAIWVTRWDLAVASVDTIVNNVALANLNTIIFQVRGQADALYTPGPEPWSAVLSGTLGQNPGWDPLAEMIGRAHARGIEVHAWVNVYPAWSGTSEPATWPPDPTSPRHMYPDYNQQFPDQRWLQWTTAGPMQFPTQASPGYVWANPAAPSVVQRVVDVAKYLLKHYELDGLHFDYIRYADPGGAYSYDPITQQVLGANPGLSRGDFQRAQVTGLLERVRAEALPERPSARLSAAVWPVYKDTWGWVNGNDGYSANYQDSHGWASRRLVDGIMPMLYTLSIKHERSRFEILAADHVSGAQPGGVMAGIIGDYDFRRSTAPNTPGYEDPFAEIAWRIETARAAGAYGQALFSYRLFDNPPCPEGNPSCGINYWALLRNGPYRTVASPRWP